MPEQGHLPVQLGFPPKEIFMPNIQFKLSKHSNYQLKLRDSSN